jgi:tRNA (guanine37-N1)-methyltransferase
MSFAPPVDLSVVLLHDGMLNKEGREVVTSLTLIDVHDIARSARTYNATSFYVAHPSQHLRALARTLTEHWLTGYGSTYNNNRKEALSAVQVVASLDDAVTQIELRTGVTPVLMATSAKDGEGMRMSFEDARSHLLKGDPALLMLGTGHGMTQELLDRASVFLSPVKGPGMYNHLSVRSACAIMLDRMLGVR